MAAPGQAPARPGAPGFTVDLGLEGAARTLAATPAAALDAMLALQEAEAESVRDRAARRHGKALLEALAALQHALLGGEEGPALQRLAALLAAMPEAADPRLGAVLRAVALRAQVELARREV